MIGKSTYVKTVSEVEQIVIKCQLEFAEKSFSTLIPAEQVGVHIKVSEASIHNTFIYCLYQKNEPPSTICHFYLGNGKSHELCVFSRCVKDAEWNRVGYPLHLMDHSLDKNRLRQSVLKNTICNMYTCRPCVKKSWQK